jgi:hypothetical protein
MLKAGVDEKFMAKPHWLTLVVLVLLAGVVELVVEFEGLVPLVALLVELVLLTGTGTGAL